MKIGYSASNGRSMKHDVRDSCNRLKLDLEAGDDNERAFLARLRAQISDAQQHGAHLSEIFTIAATTEQQRETS